MAKKKQRQYKTGSVYQLQGPSGRGRNLVFAGLMKIEGWEYLAFRPVKTIAKKRVS
jgi:hypothetical protein